MLAEMGRFKRKFGRNSSKWVVTFSDEVCFDKPKQNAEIAVKVYEF